MQKVSDAEFLEELKFFRWTLYHYGTFENDDDNGSESGNSIRSGSETEEVTKIDFDSVTESDEIIGSIIRYHCDHQDDEVIAEELIIAKHRGGKVYRFF